MATYYVNPAYTHNGDGSLPTPATGAGQPGAFLYISSVLALALTGANTVYLSAGTHSHANAYMALTAAKHSNLTIIGAGVGQTIVAPTDNHGLLSGTGVNSVVLKDLTIRVGTNKVAVWGNGGTGLTIKNVELISNSGHTSSLLIVANDPTLHATNVTIRHNNQNGSPISLTGTTAGILAYITSVAVGTASRTVFWNLASSGTVDISHCIIFDSHSHGIYQNNAGGTVVIKNCVIQGGVGTGAGAAVTRNAGTLVETNNVLISSWLDGDGMFGIGFTPHFTDILIAGPQFRQPARGGFIVPHVDDSTNFAYAQMLELLLTAKGFRGTFYLQRHKTFAGRSVDNGWLSANTPALREMVNRGTMEVAGHTASHSDLTLLDNAPVWTVGTGTVTVARSGGSGGNGLITYSGGGTVDQFRTKTLAAIRGELNALGANVSDGTIYNAGEATGGKIQDTALGEVLKEASAGASTITLLVDPTAAGGLYRAEMVDPRAWLADEIINGAGVITDPQTSAPYQVRSFGFPYNATNTTSQAAVREAGYTGARGNTTSTSFGYLTAVDVFSMYALGSSYLVGASEEATRQNARNIAFAAAQSGLLVSVLSHSVSEISLENWAIILDEWARFGPGITVTSAQIATATIKQAPWSDAGNGVWSRTYTDSGDYRLRATSPARDAGANLAATLVNATDMAGRAVYRDGVFVGPGAAPDIGAYEYVSEAQPGYGFSSVQPSHAFSSTQPTIKIERMV